MKHGVLEETEIKNVVHVNAVLILLSFIFSTYIPACVEGRQ